MVPNGMSNTRPAAAVLGEDGATAAHAQPARQAADLEQQSHDPRHPAKTAVLRDKGNVVDEIGKVHRYDLEGRKWGLRFGTPRGTSWPHVFNRRLSAILPNRPVRQRSKASIIARIFSRKGTFSLLG
jgi:hypothetical protein